MSETDTFRSLGEITAGIVDKLSIGTVELHQVTDRESWLKMRAADVTASDIASICSVGYRSPLAVWAEKKGLTTPQAEGAILRRGRWLEPAIWAAIKDENPTWEIRAAKVYLRAPSLRLGATPDALAIDPSRDGIVLLQGKVVSKPIFERDWAPDGAAATAPLDYQLQTITETMLVEAAYGLKQTIHPVLAALVIGTFDAELHLIPVNRHAAAEQKIMQTVKQFWSDFDAGIQPRVDPTQDHDVVKSLYPTDNGKTIDLTGDNKIPELIDERKRLGMEIKDLDDRKKLIETEIRGKIGEHSYAQIAGDRWLSLTVTERDGYYVNPTSFRTLREVKMKAVRR
jgi:YqaJ-like viral recombinase domain